MKTQVGRKKFEIGNSKFIRNWLRRTPLRSGSSFIIRNWIPHSSFLILLLFSCSPAKRLDRLVSRHPELKQADTITIRDTLISPGIRADTTLHLDQLYDTVVLEKERLQVKLLRMTDTLRVEGTCNPDTIFYEKQIPIEKIKLVTEPFSLKTLKPVLWLLVGILLLVLILRLVIK